MAAWAQAALTANRTRPYRGAKELLLLLLLLLLLSDAALRSSRYDLTESLLEVRSELVPDDVTRGMMAIVAGRHLAESAFLFEDAFEQYEKAIAAFNRALTRDPAEAGAHVHRSGALFRLGEAQAAVGRQEPALESLREAILAAGRPSCWTPGSPTRTAIGATLMRLGELEAKAGHHGEARAAFGEAVADVEAVLSLTPDDARAYNIAGIAYRGRGNAEDQLGLADEARASFRAAIEGCSEATRIVPDFAYAHYSLGWPGATSARPRREPVVLRWRTTPTGERSTPSSRRFSVLRARQGFRWGYPGADPPRAVADEPK